MKRTEFPRFRASIIRIDSGFCGDFGRLLARNAQAFLFQRLAQPNPVLAHSGNRCPHLDRGSLLLGLGENAQ